MIDCKMFKSNVLLAFDALKGTGSLDNGKIESGFTKVAASGVDLLNTIGVAGLLIGFVIVAICIVLKKNSKSFADSKDQMLSMLIGAGILFFAAGMVCIAIDAGTGV